MIPIILAAGKGERFLKAGFTVPKPLIEFQGLPLIAWALDTARKLCKVPPVVVTTPLVAQAIRTVEDVRIVVAAQTQRGPAMSGLLAAGYLPTDQPLLFMDCDSLFQSALLIEYVREFERRASLSGLIGVERTEEEQSTAFCGFELKNGTAEELMEKTRKGRFIGIGMYFFRNLRAFHLGVARTLLYSHGEMEIPLSAAVWNASDGPPDAFVSPRAAWTPLGTPEQLAAANGAAA